MRRVAQSSSRQTSFCVVLNVNFHALLQGQLKLNNGPKPRKTVSETLLPLSSPSPVRVCPPFVPFSHPSPKDWGKNCFLKKFPIFPRYYCRQFKSH